MNDRVSQVVGLSLVVVLAGSALSAPTQSDPTPVGADFRISASTSSEYNPDVVWNATASQFLVVWDDGRNSATRGTEIFGRRVGANGVPVGADFRISTSTSNEHQPQGVWNATANQFLVVWRDYRNIATRGSEIYGRRLGADGVPIGTDIRISTSIANETNPAVVWNATANQYLVVWNKWRSGSWAIFGRRLGADGVPVGADFLISVSSTSNWDKQSPAAVWNATDNQYVVVWHDGRFDESRGYEIYGIRVGADGVPIGTEFRISNSTADEFYPEVVWNAAVDQYLVVWQGNRAYATRGWDIFGRRVGADGVPVGTDFQISTAASDQSHPQMVWNEIANQYFIAWMDMRSSATRGVEVFGRRIGADGVPVGVDIRISPSASDEYTPAVVWSATTNQYLVVWQDKRNFATRGWEIYGRRLTGDPAP